MLCAEEDFNSWKPDVLLNPQLWKDKHITILLLNEFSFNKKVACLWNQADLRVCVDGGCNELYGAIQNCSAELPHIISGDFDSVKSGTLEYFRSKGSQIIFTPDQNETDFTKALKIVKEKLEIDCISSSIILVLDGCSGRLDHMFSNMSTLHKAYMNLNLTNVTIFSSRCLVWILWPSKHFVTVPPLWRKEFCGLIPLGRPCENISTNGLKWNLSKQAK